MLRDVFTGKKKVTASKALTLNAANKRTELEIQRAALESRIEEVGAAKPSAESDLAKELLAKRDQLREVTVRVA